MKKRILMVVACLIVLVGLTGCTKTALTTDKFKTTLEGKKFELTDTYKQHEDEGNFKEATLAKSESGYEIEFVVLDNEDRAKNVFGVKKKEYEDLRGNVASSQVETNIGNYNSYAVTSNGLYMYVIRVDSTVLYLKAEDKYKNEIKDLIKELGY